MKTTAATKLRRARARIARLEARLQGAGTMIRDLANGWPIRELHEPPAVMLDRIKRLLPGHDIAPS